MTASSQPKDKLAKRLDELAEHVSDVHFTCDIVHALARACLDYREAFKLSDLFQEEAGKRIDAELSKGLGL